MKTRQHVLGYTDDPDQGGVAVYNHALLCGLARAGYLVSCVQTECINPRLEQQRQLGVRHHWLGFHTRRDATRSATNLDDPRRAFEPLRPDLGDSGKLLPSPHHNPTALVAEIVTTLEAWAREPEQRRRLGAAGRARAEQLFREERMIHQTIQVLERALLPAGDYVSPGYEVIRPDACFPHLTSADPNRVRGSTCAAMSRITGTWTAGRPIRASPTAMLIQPHEETSCCKPSHHRQAPSTSIRASYSAFTWRASTKSSRTSSVRSSATWARRPTWSWKG